MPSTFRFRIFTFNLSMLYRTFKRRLHIYPIPDATTDTFLIVIFTCVSFFSLYSIFSLDFLENGSINRLNVESFVERFASSEENTLRLN